MLSHYPFSDWLPRRYSLDVSFAITPVADGVDEWTVSVMMNKQATSIADFRASPVRLTVSLAHFSMFGALIVYLESVASGETADSDEQRVLPVEYCPLCGLSFVRAFCTSSSAILAHCRTFVSEASPSFSVA